jgi:D-alanine-D-alanine ligase
MMSDRRREIAFMVWNCKLPAMNEFIHQTNLPVLLLYNLDRQWELDDVALVVELTETFANALTSIGHLVRQVCLENQDIQKLLDLYDPDEWLVFNWIDEIPGIPHSSALAAQQLEILGFTYTGADFNALALSQDKRKIKSRLEKAGVPTPRWEVVTSPQVITWERFPAIVKPAFEHCSFGITREAVVQTPAELAQRVNFVLETFQQPAIVEDFIDGREFHVGVLGNGKLHVLPPGEIDYSSFSNIHDRLCTYESNFDKTSLAYRLTAPRMSCALSEIELRALNNVAAQAYLTTDCRDYARMDIRLQDGTFFVLDVNPNADIGPETSLVLGAEKIGYSYGQLGSLLVNLAALRHPVFGRQA